VIIVEQDPARLIDRLSSIEITDVPKWITPRETS